MYISESSFYQMR